MPALPSDCYGKNRTRAPKPDEMATIDGVPVIAEVVAGTVDKKGRPVTFGDVLLRLPGCVSMTVSEARRRGYSVTLPSRLPNAPAQLGQGTNETGRDTRR